MNIENVEDLFGIRSMRKISDVERGALVLFAVAVLVGGGVLVGQALVRAVRAGAADLMTWRALGVDNRTAITVVTAPANTGWPPSARSTVIGVAIARVATFPGGVLAPHRTRHWPARAMVGGPRRRRPAGHRGPRRSVDDGVAHRAPRAISIRSGLRWFVQWASTLSSAPPVIVGTRSALEPGRGHRAVPVRSAFVGAIVGVLGVVGCLTVGRGLRSTVDDPARAGVTWDVAAGIDGLPPPDLLDAITTEERRHRRGQRCLGTRWSRSTAVPSRRSGPRRLKGDIDFVVLEGRPPVAADEVAMAPVTMDELGLHIGDEILVGPGSDRSRHRRRPRAPACDVAHRVRPERVDDVGRIAASTPA